MVETLVLHSLTLKVRAAFIELARSLKHRNVLLLELYFSDFGVSRREMYAYYHGRYLKKDALS